MSHRECGADASQHSMERASPTAPARPNTRSPPRMSRRLNQSRSRSQSRSPEEINLPFRTRQPASRTTLQVGPPLPALNTLPSHRIHEDEDERPEAYSPPMLHVCILTSTTRLLFQSQEASTPPRPPLPTLSPTKQHLTPHKQLQHRHPALSNKTVYTLGNQPLKSSSNTITKQPQSRPLHRPKLPD